MESQQDEIVFCKRCHRKLKDEQSKKLGYGIICYKKVKRKLIKKRLFEWSDNSVR